MTIEEATNVIKAFLFIFGCSFSLSVIMFVIGIILVLVGNKKDNALNKVGYFLCDKFIIGIIIGFISYILAVIFTFIYFV